MISMGTRSGRCEIGQCHDKNMGTRLGRSEIGQGHD